MSTKHTQGEWGVSKHGNNDSFGVYAEGKPDLAIVIGGNEEGGEAEANAKLIAAAPDMLDALQSIEQSLEQMVQDDMIRGMVMIIQQVINKAIN